MTLLVCNINTLTKESDVTSPQVKRIASYEVDKSEDPECGGEDEGRRDAVSSDEAERESHGRVTQDRRNHQPQEHLARCVPFNLLTVSGQSKVQSQKNENGAVIK